jgi:hypothetical protein
MTRGPLRRLPKSLRDFGDMTPHTLVGGAQTTLTATASARAGRRDCPSEALGPRDKTHTPPLARRFGPARGGHRGRRYGPKVPDPIGKDQGFRVGKGV